jgi:cytoskeleton protein RodZ
MPGPDDKPGVQGSGLGLGERLRSARKARALSLEQLAEALHLDETVILALENERFEEFGAPVFVRGHLKAYAKLVGLPVDGILEAYRAADPTVDDMPVIARHRGGRSVSVNLATLGFWGLVLIVGLSLAFYVLQDEPDTVASRPEPETSVTPPPAAGESRAGFDEQPRRDDESLIRQEESPEIPVTTVDEGELEPPVVQAEPAVESVASEVDAPLEPADPTVRLNLYFRQESWVEISDIKNRLLFGLQREGLRRELVGEPPFRFVLGNGQGVDLQIEGRPYDIPVARPGRVTRFEIKSAMLDR